MWIFGLVLLAVAAGLAWGYRAKRRRLGRIVSTEIYTVEHLRQLAESMAEGFGSGSLRFPAGVRGTARCAEPLVSELAEVPSVYYSMRVQREYEATEASTGADHRVEEKTRRGSDQVAHNQRSIPFHVEDATGSLRVDPSGARFIAEKTLSRFEPATPATRTLKAGSFTFELPAAEPGGSKTLGYRFEEEAVPVGREVFVLGDVTDPEGELRIVGPESEGDLLVSLKSRSQVIRDLGRGANGMKIAAIVCAALGLLLVLFG